MLANGCQSGLIGAILAPIEANRDGTSNEHEETGSGQDLRATPANGPSICRESRLRASHSSRNISRTMLAAVLR